MPIVHIRALPPAAPSTAASLCTEVADAVARAVGCPVHDVWVTFTPVIALSLGRELTTQGTGDIAFVELLMRTRASERVQAGLRAAAGTVAATLEMPVEDVWARYSPVRSCEVFAGGEVLNWEAREG